MKACCRIEKNTSLLAAMQLAANRCSGERPVGCDCVACAIYAEIRCLLPKELHAVLCDVENERARPPRRCRHWGCTSTARYGIDGPEVCWSHAGNFPKREGR